MYKLVDKKSLQNLLKNIRLAPENFIPIIGPELMVYKIEGKWISVYDLIAERLADELLTSNLMTKPYTLNDVIQAYYSEQDYDEYVLISDTPYRTIKKILTDTKWEIPEPVKNLAEISDFKFYINATWLPFISDALKIRQENIVEKTNLITSEEYLDDLDDPSNTKEIIRVYHLFGDAKKLPANAKFGLTDEDILFLAHNLISNCPENLNYFLKNTHRKLLLFGCDFSSWLIRLIFLSIRKDSKLTPKSIYLVGSSCANNPHLDLFWHRLNSVIYKNKDSVSIVNDFYTSWKEEIEKSLPIDIYNAIGDKALKNFVFISYDTNDLDKAIVMKEKLRIRGTGFSNYVSYTIK